ncbi:hypothetical protein SCHPADRAFT_891906 [Schizopora paradoxa]|uniref:Uncharacterized protein n=1 Tax=Schizopora paradoxa TaxID=27342 RepID=A0A0H2S242_9AGAM|nr:hypothetical protein SCHPADRAFT_891906 [Schizopora paradoxa]
MPIPAKKLQVIRGSLLAILRLLVSEEDPVRGGSLQKYRGRASVSFFARRKTRSSGARRVRRAMLCRDDDSPEERKKPACSSRRRMRKKKKTSEKGGFERRCRKRNELESEDERKGWRDGFMTLGGLPRLWLSVSLALCVVIRVHPSTRLRVRTKRSEVESRRQKKKKSPERETEAPREGKTGSGPGVTGWCRRGEGDESLMLGACQDPRMRCWVSLL